MSRQKVLVSLLSLFLLVVVATTLATASNEQQPERLQPFVSLPPLPYGLNGLRPHISHETVNLHYNAHQQAYVTGVNSFLTAKENQDKVSKLWQSYRDSARAAEIAAVQNAAATNLGDFGKRSTSSSSPSQQNQSFVTYLSRVLDKGTPASNAAGQTYNHALYFQSLTDEPIPLEQYVSYAVNSPLVEAIKRDFTPADATVNDGSATAAVTELLRIIKEKAVKHFASGWVWLAVVKKKSTNNNSKFSLAVVDSHDAQTIFDKTSAESLCGKDDDSDSCADSVQPLLVLDCWEHAYYVDVRNKRADYVDAWFKVVDWRRVERRFVAVTEEGRSVEVRASQLSQSELATRMLNTAPPETDGYPHFI